MHHSAFIISVSIDMYYKHCLMCIRNCSQHSPRPLTCSLFLFFEQTSAFSYDNLLSSHSAAQFKSEGLSFLTDQPPLLLGLRYSPLKQCPHVKSLQVCVCLPLSSYLIPCTNRELNVLSPQFTMYSTLRSSVTSAVNNTTQYPAIPAN